MKKLNTEDPNFKDQLSQLIFFEAEDNIQIEKTVTEILSDVKKRGDEAVIEYTKKFDHVDFSRMEEFEISKEELNLALENNLGGYKYLIQNTGNKLQLVATTEILKPEIGLNYYFLLF